MLRKVKTMMPEGTIPVGIGLLVLGFCIYVFQAFATRTFGKSGYGAFGAMWMLTFVVVPGLFLPIEQELGRALSARSTRGEGAGPLIRKAATLAVGLFVATSALCLIFQGPLDESLFKGNSGLLYALIFAMFGYMCAFIVRGVLAGSGRFGSYGLLLGLEGVVRTVIGIGLLIAGNKSYLAWGLLVGLSPLLAAVVAVLREKNLVTPGPDASYSELSASLGWLLLGSLLAQTLLNAAPLLVQGTAKTANEHELASQFVSAVFISRIPLFLFQAVQAALLPKLARMAAANQMQEFRHGLEKLLALVVVIGVLATVGSFVAGPFVMGKMFGPGFHISGKDLGLLALGNAIFMLALAGAQALIALSALAKAAQSWLVGGIAFAVTALVTTGLYNRAEWALLAGAIASTLAMLSFVSYELRKSGANPSVKALIDASAPYHELIEP